MDDSRSANPAWDRLRDSYGSAGGVVELLTQIAAGEDAWGDLIGRVLHQGTLYEATPHVISWLVQALEQGKLAGRPFAVGKAFGATEVLNGGILAFAFLS